MRSTVQNGITAAASSPVTTIALCTAVSVAALSACIGIRECAAAGPVARCDGPARRRIVFADNGNPCAATCPVARVAKRAKVPIVAADRGCRKFNIAARRAVAASFCTAGTEIAGAVNGAPSAGAGPVAGVVEGAEVAVVAASTGRRVIDSALGCAVAGALWGAGAGCRVIGAVNRGTRTRAVALTHVIVGAEVCVVTGFP